MGDGFTSIKSGANPTTIFNSNHRRMHFFRLYAKAFPRRGSISSTCTPFDQCPAPVTFVDKPRPVRLSDFVCPLTYHHTYRVSALEVKPSHGIVPCQPYGIEPRFRVNHLCPIIRYTPPKPYRRYSMKPRKPIRFTIGNLAFPQPQAPHTHTVHKPHNDFNMVCTIGLGCRFRRLYNVRCQ